MARKPTGAPGYPAENTGRVRQVCLHLATKLGDLLDDLVVVGGLVPSLLIDQGALPEGTPAHAGTMDLDLGLGAAILEEGRYRALAERLRGAGFAPDRNERGRPTVQRWRSEGPRAVAVDFLIPPTRRGDRGGSIRHLEAEFGALIAPGLHLAFRDQARAPLSGLTLEGARARRNMWVSGPGAYVILKALAFDGRGENKDAYDLFYVLRNYAPAVDDVASHLRPLAGDPAARRALKVLRRDFVEPGATGPMGVARFVLGRPDVAIQADVAGYVRRLLDLLATGRTSRR